jgi:hypothetical protein
MELAKGAQLGLLHTTLGIAPESRVSVRITPTGAVVWDFSTGTRYSIDGTNRTVDEAAFQVPDHVKQIIAASSDELLKRWDAGSGWDDERSTIFSELSVRGVNILPWYRQKSTPAFDKL